MVVMGRLLLKGISRSGAVAAWFPAASRNWR
jgi:hypothetical protein